MKSMSDERSEHLVTCAADVARMMNLGVHPNAALRKVAEDGALNAEEVKRVSEATNNAKTVSVLAQSQPKDRAAPFLLTNADTVNADLFSKNPDAEQEGKEDTTGNFDANKLKSKKQAALASLTVSGDFLAVADPEHTEKVAALRESMGIDPVAHRRVKMAVEVDAEANVILHVENETTGNVKTASMAEARLAHNPYLVGGSAGHLRDDARLHYVKCAQDAASLLEKVANDLRLASAPRFAEVEKLARAHGVPPQFLDLVYEHGNLARIGEKRAAADARLVPNDYGIVTVDGAARAVVTQLHKVGALLQEASDAFGIYSKLDDGVTKLAASVVDAVKNLSMQAQDAPDKLLGRKVDHSRAIDFIGNATGTMSPADATKPSFEGATSPLDANTRQGLENNNAAMSVQKLMSDEFIGKHPLHRVVDAYNRMRSVNPNLGEAELNGLVKHDLSTDGAVPLDTLHRARPTSK